METYTKEINTNKTFEGEAKSSDVVYSKYYACLVPLGHAEDGYVIWAMMPIIAKNPEDARRIIREELPHVKDDKSYTISGLIEITNTEYKLLKEINDFDAYLFSKLPPDHPLVIERRMLIPENEDRISQDRHKMKEIVEGKKRYGIKFESDFPSWMILQRALAPFIKNGQLKHGKIDMFPLLGEYFTAMIQHIIIDGNYPIRNMGKHGTDEQLVHAKAEMLIRYCKLFGPNNPLGIIYSAKNHTFSYPVEGQSNLAIFEIPQPNDYETKIWNSGCPAKYSSKKKPPYVLPRGTTPEEIIELEQKLAQSVKEREGLPSIKFSARQEKTRILQEKLK